MEDELKDACNEFLATANDNDFRLALWAMVNRATHEQLVELAETILFGLGEDRTH